MGKGPQIKIAEFENIVESDQVANKLSRSENYVSLDILHIYSQVLMSQSQGTSKTTDISK